MLFLFFYYCAILLIIFSLGADLRKAKLKLVKSNQVKANHSSAVSSVFAFQLRRWPTSFSRGSHGYTQQAKITLNVPCRHKGLMFPLRLSVKLVLQG